MQMEEAHILDTIDAQRARLPAGREILWLETGHKGAQCEVPKLNFTSQIFNFQAEGWLLK